MDKQNEKRKQEGESQPGSMSSFNNRPHNRGGSVEEVEEKKEEGESYMDYNGNSEENAPVRARE